MIEAEFGVAVVVTQINDPGVTGNFEVTVGDELVHSKMTKGHGKCTDATETQKVIDAIQTAVDK